MKTKICTKCGIKKLLSDFYKDKSHNNGVRCECKQCNDIRKRNWDKKHKIHVRNNHKKYRQLHYKYLQQLNKKYYEEHKKDLLQYRQKIKKESPWILTWYRINNRCNNTNNLDYPLYGGKGIKNKLTQEDCKFLWFRDKAYLLKQASIHRKNSNKNYTISNCCYIEQTENIGLANTENKSKKVLQFTKKELFIQEHNSIRLASKLLNITETNICNALSKRTRTAGGFIWKYK